MDNLITPIGESTPDITEPDKIEIDDAARTLLRALMHTPFTQHPVDWTLETFGDFTTTLRELTSLVVTDKKTDTANPEDEGKIQCGVCKKWIKPDSNYKRLTAKVMAISGNIYPAICSSCLAEIGEIKPFPKLLNAHAIMREHIVKYHDGIQCKICKDYHPEYEMLGGLGKGICKECFMNMLEEKLK